MDRWRVRGRLALLVAPLCVLLLAYFLYPLAHLALLGAGKGGMQTYASLLRNHRYLAGIRNSLILSAITTLATLGIGVLVGTFLERVRFPGRRLVVALVTFPLAFPGVVVGFMVILLAGRQGVIGWITQTLWGVRSVFAYSLSGLFLGYLYFSIPRVVLTVMAATAKLDLNLEEAARSLGASDWMVPGLLPSLVSGGAICFATCMGAFGTAFTLAQQFEVLPMVIYTEFTLSFNIATASALAFCLGLATWLCLFTARLVSGDWGEAA